MTAPGGGFNDSAHGDEANPLQPGGQAPERPTQQPPWEPPGSDYPPPAYQPPGYSAGHPAMYPPPGPPYPPGPLPAGGPPPGYGALPYPDGYDGYYAMPDYHYFEQGGYGPPDLMQPGTNGLAIASLILSLTGFLCCFVGSIVGIVLGVVALSQIRQTRQGGYGMAVAGIVIGIGTLLVGLVFTTLRIHTR
jgi:hypothetical protein